ncbi:phosphotyrosine protein phosphatase I superfamily [Cokeromyces recurvatus]|uniref:phosphotyrosine protein phosphatase I superfamily n=1 Tax=Cokeromyces recurvatus TaxID=90255 RepID=UPI00221F84D3|nr:phosphotyrosine protein phosphatase I superfamily [Cokeromyces recurvatus]KAI7903183.1 phosphotyrosine protein phosphatase I superfamily [Cokeromyces recurvatus]
MSKDPISVLFVCLGNICRSPMAEAVFAHTVKEHDLQDKFRKIDSAGTASYHVGSIPDSRSSFTCKSHGVPVNHKARKVTKKDFEDFDYVLCMDEYNLSDLKGLAPSGSKAVIKLFGEYDPKGERIIEDPYYGGRDGFEHNFKQVTRASKGFLKSLDLI